MTVFIFHLLFLWIRGCFSTFAPKEKNENDNENDGLPSGRQFFVFVIVFVQNTTMTYGTLLAVDDNPAILTALRYCLSGTFDNILTLTSPKDILVTMATEEITMVILDMNFSTGVNSGQEGLFWLSTIRKHHPDVPVVLLTAYGDIQLAVRGLKSGAVDFITKPWDNAELVGKLVGLLEQKNEMATLDEMEAEHIRLAIDRSKGNLSIAAKLLGISRQTLYNKMKKL